MEDDGMILNLVWNGEDRETDDDAQEAPPAVMKGHGRKRVSVIPGDEELPPAKKSKVDKRAGKRSGKERRVPRGMVTDAINGPGDLGDAVGNGVAYEGLGKQEKPMARAQVAGRRERAAKGATVGAEGAREFVNRHVVQPEEAADVASAVAQMLALDKKYVGDEYFTSEKKCKLKAVKKGQTSKGEGGPRRKSAAERFAGWEHRPCKEAAKDWGDLGLADSLSCHLKACGFKAPQKLQSAAIPAVLSGRDVLMAAGPGAGKTLAYLAPIVHDLQAQEPRISRGEGTHAVVLCPSREACSAVGDVLAVLLKRYHWLTGGHFTGTDNRGHEKARLRKGTTVVVATVSRLLDHMENTAAFRVNELRWLVIDQCGRQLDSRLDAKVRIAQRRLQEGLESAGNPRQRMVVATGWLHQKLPRFVSWALQSPICVGVRPEAREGERCVFLEAEGGMGIVVDDGPAAGKSGMAGMSRKARRQIGMSGASKVWGERGGGQRGRGAGKGWAGR
ncbi:unnamed protein product [Ostreobium quekettii]|uniref:ATP-dependent RNA helicase n=1 Tax=Ostreobium quekettii TaxID=121088 RepID=A0A8S1IZP6_9CHLO|nr:unnamed protein product [Ostreobium quekettii]